MGKKSCSVVNADIVDEDIVDEDIVNEDIVNEDIVDINNKIYYKLLISIRNYGILSIDDLYYIDTLPKCNLIEIIKIYNLHMININELKN